MSLNALAEHLVRLRCERDIVKLHVADTLAAFFIGARTVDGNALAAVYGAREDGISRAAVAAAIARLSECDDIHLASCVTPGAVVVPVALAFCDHAGAEGFGRAVTAGYTAGLRCGLAVGGPKALASGVWPTLFAAPLMAAVTASSIRGHDVDQLAHAMALALSRADGRAPRASSARWFALAEAVSNGLRASQAAGEGTRGDLSMLSEPWLASQAGHAAIALSAFDPSVPFPSISEVGFKPFPIARQGLNAVLAFQRLVHSGLDHSRIDTIDVLAPKVNVALLSRPAIGDDRLSRLCNIGYQLACAALAPDLLDDPERSLGLDAPFTDFAHRVRVVASADLDGYLPNRWAARVVASAAGDDLEQTVIQTPFDHDSPTLAQELDEKWRRLLPAEDARNLFSNTGNDYPDTLWQMIEQRVSMLSKHAAPSSEAKARTIEG